jgi:thioredoxin
METTDQTFEKDVIKKSAKVPVLVDFWASWCGPCQMLGPIIEKIAQDYRENKLVVAKLNIEENQKTSAEYNIMSIPAVKLFKNGEVVNEFIGLKSESDIREWIDSNL